jgi:hypothetical protein
METEPLVNPVTIKSYFKSTDRNIFALSDIHADIHSLIICLRDLAEVIEREPGTPNTLEELLMKDISNDDEDKAYLPALNFKWKENNKSYIVIVGDILDGRRVNSYEEDNGIYKDIPNKVLEHQYPQIEIKILKFINALNEQAKPYGGYIFKVLGNHEIMNMRGYPEDIEQYMFTSDKTLQNYYKGISRLNMFKYGSSGLKLLFEGGCWCLLVINNLIFVHGQITDEPFSTFVTYNIFLNKQINTMPEKINDNPPINYSFILNELCDPDTSILWMREYGSPKKIHERILHPVESTKFCEKVKTQITNFIGTHEELKEVENFKIIIGHSQQNESTNKEYNNRTFTTIVKQGPVKIEYTLAETGLSNPAEKIVFGISMECGSNDTSDIIYRVDVASSRSFDSRHELLTFLGASAADLVSKNNAETKIYFSRTPSVLSISYDNKISIIKSTMKNTTEKQPRKLLNNFIQELEAFNPLLKFHNDPKKDGIRYVTNYDKDENYELKKKYLKYKIKYINLKSSFIK